MLSNQFIVEELAGQFGTEVAEFEEPHGLLTLSTTPSSILDVMKFLRDEERLAFNFLTDITALHTPDVAGREFCVVYHLHSFINAIRVRVKVFLPKENLDIPTATTLWASANWMERETFDFYGINFVGHPKLKRILNMEDMDYHPMRKEYPLEDATREDKIDALFGR